MPTNWPPADAPAWPPPEFDTTWLSCSDIRALVATLKEHGFTQAAPTTAENQTYFSPARCDHGDRVVGRMLVSPGGIRYPFAVCNDGGHRALLASWPPYDCGSLSGVE